MLDMDRALVKLARTIDWRFTKKTGSARSETTIPAGRSWRCG
ncbi:hypothetical protein X737_04650 [Mesorhizobium sp. L48C026A00]|nr:hypothetical protein [Mesorhizobium sp. L48C026A00]ESZ21428.1 hypothetical protein X737_04650 [Mesorhizobium sp. L48C026A00]